MSFHRWWSGIESGDGPTTRTGACPNELVNRHLPFTTDTWSKLSSLGNLLNMRTVSVANPPWLREGGKWAEVNRTILDTSCKGLHWPHGKALQVLLVGDSITASARSCDQPDGETPPLDLLCRGLPDRESRSLIEPDRVSVH